MPTRGLGAAEAKVTGTRPERIFIPPPPSRRAPTDTGLVLFHPWGPPGRARTGPPEGELQDPSQASADDLGRQMARRVGRQREAHVPCQDDTQKYIPVIAGCQWRCQREMPCVFLDTL